MKRKALVVIDIQNDITKHYRDIIDRLNAAIEWAAESGMEIVYIQHNNLSPGTRTFKPNTKGAELVPELKIVSEHIFVKTKANALASEEFSEFIRSKDIREFYHLAWRAKPPGFSRVAAGALDLRRGPRDFEIPNLTASYLG